MSQNVQTHHGGTAFGIQMSKTDGPLWRKDMCKSKCAKRLMAGPILESQMSKNGTPLWGEAHLQIKMYKTPAFWHTFGASVAEKVSDRTDR